LVSATDWFGDMSNLGATSGTVYGFTSEGASTESSGLIA